MKLDDPVQFLKGVGPRRAGLLEKSGIHTMEDLLYHLPFRYEDRRRILRVEALRPGYDATLLGGISDLREIDRRGGSRRSMLRATFRDDSGWLALLWFHQVGYFRRRLASADFWLIHGRVEAGRPFGLKIVHPEIEPVTGEQLADPQLLARVEPVYQKPTDLALATMRTLVGRVVQQLAGDAQSAVPPQVRRRLGLLDLGQALRDVHQPPVDVDLEALDQFRTEAQRTLIFEELFVLQTGMQLRKARRALLSAVALPESRELQERFLASLPFAPTRAQRRVIAEVAADMARPHPMNRLVHGDVGSGKTVVAFAAALQAVAAGYQVAFMAPTELLAEQHLATMEPWAEAAGIRLSLLSGDLGPVESSRVRACLAEGKIDLIVGTHALIQESTMFARLGLAVIDEQHRFGVLQRATLKGGETDALLLSATPIPRTLAFALFGDMDVSFLDELPPGRRPATTRVIRRSSRARLYERMAAAMAGGQQCYIVYPLVEESEKMDLADATSMAKRLKSGPLRSFRVGLIHGRMRGEEKETVMRRFKEGALDCLVATTVIEVGIDVPRASIMVVEHAERFGLAQLHQLRGRVGRGGGDAFCCLVAGEGQSPEAMERLRVMERTTNGFDVAEADLRLRGPGEYLGTKQSGLPAFRAANLVRDATLLELARREALAWLEQDGNLATRESRTLRRTIERRWGERLRLAEVG